MKWRLAHRLIALFLAADYSAFLLLPLSPAHLSGTNLRLGQGKKSSPIKAYRDNLSVIKDFIPQPARSFRLAYDLLF